MFGQTAGCLFLDSKEERTLPWDEAHIHIAEYMASFE